MASTTPELAKHHSLETSDSQKFSDEFFVDVGTVANWFSEQVRRTLNAYEAAPETFTPEEEMIVLNRMNLGVGFEKPGIADQDGVWRVADQLRRIARNVDFSYVSELGRRYAEYCDEADRGAFFVADDSGYKPLVGYDADSGGVQYESPWESNIEKYTYANAASANDSRVKQAFASVLNSPSFQSFIAKELRYGTKDFGEDFPIILYARFMLNQTPESYETSSRVMAQLPEDIRPIVAGAFVATEYGDDLGEQIMAVAEQNNGDVIEVLPLVTRILKSIRDFTNGGIFAEIDTNLADDIRRGISTRASEILYSYNQRASKGKDVDRPVEALNKLMEWTTGVAKMLSVGVPQKVQQTGDTKVYHFIDPENGKKYPGAVELTTHGKFVEDATLRERYVKEGRGARISLTYDESNPEAALSLNGAKRRAAMNGRFDKSVYNIRTNSSEPDADHAEVSFDIASVHAPAGSLPRLVAEAIAEGSAIRDTGDGRKGGAGNFTYDIIDQEHGKRDVFAGYVGEFGDILDGRERTYRMKPVGKSVIAHALKKTA